MEQHEEGKSIAGIFDRLDGDDFIGEYPEVKFFDDDSLQSGDCQIKADLDCWMEGLQPS